MITTLLNYIREYYETDFTEVVEEILPYHDISIMIIKNPKNIYLLPEYVRGLIDEYGNLYLWCYRNEYNKKLFININTCRSCAIIM